MFFEEGGKFNTTVRSNARIVWIVHIRAVSLFYTHIPNYDLAPNFMGMGI